MSARFLFRDFELASPFILKIVPPKFKAFQNAEVVSFSLARSNDDFTEVLELRKAAYGSVRKVPENISHESLADDVDENSYILIGRHMGRIVATLRMTFKLELNHSFELEKYICISEIKSLPEEMVEISRLCVHPDFKRTDLIYGLFRQIILIMLQARKRLILGSATERMIPLYMKIGCRLTGQKYNHLFLGGEDHLVFLADVFAVAKGRIVSPLIWNLLAYEIQEQILKYHPEIEKNSFCWQMHFNRLFYPATIVALEFKKWKYSRSLPKKFVAAEKPFTTSNKIPDT